MKQKLFLILSTLCLGLCIFIRYLLTTLFSMSFLDAFYMCGLTLMIAAFFMKTDSRKALQTGLIIYTAYNLIDLLARRNMSAAFICLGSIVMLYMTLALMDKPVFKKTFFIPGLLICLGMFIMVYDQMGTLSTYETLVFLEPLGIILMMLYYSFS